MMREPVLAWLPEQAEPVAAGTFALDEARPAARGEFTYGSDFLAHPLAYPLDPVALPLSRARQRETRQDGIFGILLDAGPDAWGRRLLEARLGHAPSPLEALLHARGDGAGNLMLGALADRLPARFPALAALAPAARYFDAVQAGTPYDAGLHDALRDAGLDRPGTSLGGMKPKLTVAIDGEPWIAKFAERGETAWSVEAEHAMLAGAAAAGLRACTSRLHRLADDRAVLLVKRFDRAPAPAGGMARLGYASGHTVLQLPADYTGTPRHSYLSLADELRRWCADAGYDAREEQRELWRRLVFNVLIGNTDDHPRNHGLLRHAHGWRLSPAFDLVPHAGAARMAQAMPFWLDEGRPSGTASAQGLLAHCDRFGYAFEEARDALGEMARQVRDAWRDWMAAAGMPAEAIARRASAFGLCDVLLEQLASVVQPRTGRRGRR
ncbi:MAG: type II toxin-antitoxin system HipA family toxin [Betaproteobacteria bacterium]|nr:type II toxin-antitoxin system HipA family toxin [Betaproteobacteria bacterium]